MIISCNTIVDRRDHVQYLTVSKSYSYKCTCSLTEQNSTLKKKSVLCLIQSFNWGNLLKHHIQCVNADANENHTKTIGTLRVLTRILKTGFIEPIPGKSWIQN